MTLDERRRKYCGGCRNDFYNGNNPHGVKQCWSLEKSKVVWKDVYWSIHQVKPSRVRTLDCFHPVR